MKLSIKKSKVFLLSFLLICILALTYLYPITDINNGLFAAHTLTEKESATVRYIYYGDNLNSVNFTPLVTFFRSTFLVGDVITARSNRTSLPQTWSISEEHTFVWSIEATAGGKFKGVIDLSITGSIGGETKTTVSDTITIPSMTVISCNELYEVRVDKVVCYRQKQKWSWFKWRNDGEIEYYNGNDNVTNNYTEKSIANNKMIGYDFYEQKIN